MILHNKNKKKIYFSKMHGLSNDFVIINCINQNFIPSSYVIKKFSNRHTGIGFDQMLLVEKSNNLAIDFNYRIFNADGSEVEQCGNGARCFGLFVQLKNLTNKKKIFVKTIKRTLIINFLKNNLIQVNMDEPSFQLKKRSILQKKNNFLTKVFNDNLICSIVSMGNPHCIIKVSCVNNAPVNIIGEKLQKNADFSEGINVSFMEILNKNQVRLRVYERGVGETKACGSGACAAVAIGIAQNILSSEVTVSLTGGDLIIKWKGFGHPLYMIGSAEHVYDGFFNI